MIDEQEDLERYEREEDEREARRELFQEELLAEYGEEENET
jgi:hypothetical protein